MKTVTHSRTIHFNTGRKYQPDGQWISALIEFHPVYDGLDWLADATITFVDHSRGVDGQFTATLDCTGVQDYAADVLMGYDRGGYTYPDQDKYRELRRAFNEYRQHNGV